MKRILQTLIVFLALPAYSQVDCVDPELICPVCPCPLIYAPVCGCDNVTYDNDCLAVNLGGVTSWTPGECTGTGDCIDETLIDPDAICLQIWDPVCGCDDVTYANECEAVNYGGVTSWTPGECSGGGVDECQDLAGINFGPCEVIIGAAIVNGSCQYVSGCGMESGNVDYSPAFYETLEACEFACGDGCVNPDAIDEEFPCEGAFEPVCGCNDVTYVNACQAEHYGGVTSWTDGPCNCPDPQVVDPEIFCIALWDPVCGCDGVTYGNECEAWYWGGVTEWTPGECEQEIMCEDLGDIDFGDCDLPLGIIWDGEGCVSISGCDWEVDGTDYSPYFFENFTDCANACGDTLCINPDIIDLDIMCPAVIDPVCGCDGVTYNNDCEAYNWYGVTSWTEGPCETEPECIDPELIDETVECSTEVVPVCGCDTITYVNDCVAMYYNGVSEFTEGACDTPLECVVEEQIDMEMGCPEIYDPVCGCDSVTYGNSCEAWYYGGIQTWTPGECIGTSIDLNPGELNFTLRPNPFDQQLNVILPAYGNYTITVLDASGRILLSEQLIGSATRLELLGLASGLYFVTVVDDKGRSDIEKIIRR